MNSLRAASLIIAIGLLATAFGFWLHSSLDASRGARISGESLGNLPLFNFPDLAGRNRESREWAGKFLVLNFWATWCPPCREETPGFVELQERYSSKGVQFVGIAIDDKALVQEFVDTYDVNYPTLLGGMDAVTLSKEMGNRFQGLPFTVVADRAGRILVRRAGGFPKADLEAALQEFVEGG